jgi:hypothetical protein
MKVRVGPEEEQPVTISRARRQVFDYYKAVSLFSYGQPEVLACAARQGGVLGTEFVPEGDQGQINSITFPGLDVVDVCSLGTGVLPPAVAAVARNGTLVLLRDVLREPSPLVMRFEDITGVVYRVFSAQGSLLLLTSTGLYVLARLTQRFLAGEAVDRTPTPVRPIPLEVVDANLCGERWLLAALADGVLRFDLDLLIGSPPAESGEEERMTHPAPLRPTWQSHEETAERLAFQQ